MRRIRELDAIRGLAAIAIVVFHLWLPQFGWLGYAVNLFFVLSGYLITSIVLGNTLGGRFLWSFYARRALRIWPIYYVALFAVVLVNPLRHDSPDSLADLPYYLTFTQEIRQWIWGGEPKFPLAFRHTWTLAIEEQFYVFWPALLGIVGRRGLPWASGALIASAVIARAFDGNLFVLATQSDSLALGGLLAGLLDRPRIEAGPSRPRSAGFAGLGSVCLLGYLITASLPRFGFGAPASLVNNLGRAMKPFCINAAFFSLIGLIVLNAGHWSLGWLRGRFVVYLGTISFGIYLYHHILMKYTEEYFVSAGRPITFGVEAMEFGASFVLAMLSWKYLEEPILALKDRFRYDAPGKAEVGSNRSLAASDLAAVELGRG
ncbi:MAG: hypothetical protein ABS79_03000 [Planctomycetes bacterium SCN 63-9]|nr:MAG: hypothetical protein ABS79_03000 [Planctomycetes bacterium SCN 63-9]